MGQLYFSEQDLQNMDTRKRTAFMNSLTGFKSASLIGSIDPSGKTNLAIFSSVIHIGSNPALVGFVNRPDTTDRHTLENILATCSYTINHIHTDIIQQAHQTSARYPKHISEFDATGLTPEYMPGIAAPFVKESKIKYGVEFVERIDIKSNGTILIIGKVTHIFIPELNMHQDGAIDIEKAESVAISGLDSYHATNRLAKFTYAKPDTIPSEI